jgi:hypothetical protein
MPNGFQFESPHELIFAALIGNRLGKQVFRALFGELDLSFFSKKSFASFIKNGQIIKYFRGAR